MRRFEAIIQSETAPNVSSLWLRNKKLWFFEGGWKSIEGAFDDLENEGIVDIKKLLIGDRHLAGDNKVDIDATLDELRALVNNRAPIYPEIDENKGVLDIILKKWEVDSAYPSIWQKILFIIGTSEDIKEANSKSINYIGSLLGPFYYDAYMPVFITEVNSIANVPAIYHNAHLYAFLDGKLKVYNIDTNLASMGEVTEMKTIDLTLLPTYIDLELGNTAEVKAYNLEQLQKVTGTQFFVHADFGIGVGSFNSGYGGETTIQTASGDRVHYIITAEGECKKQEDRFEHSELFYNLGTIDVSSLPKTITLRNSVDMQRFRKATNLAFEATNNDSFIDDVSMNQVSVNSVTKQRLYTSPDIIYENDQDWNYIRATATTFNDRIEIYLETV